MKSKIMSWDSYCKRLRKFKQYKDLPDVEFLKRAKKLYQSKYKSVKEVDSSESTENEAGIWIDKEEAKEAENLYNAYLEKNTSLSFSDIALLKTLVFYEIQQRRIYKTINSETLKAVAEEKAYYSDKHINTLNEINVQVLQLKKTLGLCEEKKGVDPLEHLNILKRKFKIWMSNNQGSRTIVCPHCSKMVMLKIKTDCYDAIKHSFFKDRVLCNDWAWELLQQGKITKLDLAKILLGKEAKSTLYVDWLYKKIYGTTENKDPLLESGHDELKESGY